MKTSVLMYGEPAEVANELCACNEPENVLHVDLIAALGNALNRIAKLEAAVEGQDAAGAYERLADAQRQNARLLVQAEAVPRRRARRTR